jgi:hypothetical protein
MNINMIEGNHCDCKYVEIFTHCVGSTGAPSRRTGFIRGTNPKLCEVPKIAGRNTKANIFQKGSAGTKATIGLNKKICISNNNNNNNNNSIRVYLRANLTAQRPVTKFARVHRNIQNN